LKGIITEEMAKFVEAYQTPAELPVIWGEPLVAFARAEDPLFARLKSLVSQSHATPLELLKDARTVIVYFLPFLKYVPKENRLGLHAARVWALAYIHTNRLIVDLNSHLSRILEEKGYRSVVLPPTHNFDKERLTSDWSHKHVAFIAGLGKFGVHHLLITERGCCGRLGSLVTSARIEPTKRPEGEYCLQRWGRSCLKCVKKCVNGALTAEGFDRHRCYRMLLENEALYRDEGVADVCGKCSCLVPCSFHNPLRRLPAP